MEESKTAKLRCFHALNRDKNPLKGSNKEFSIVKVQDSLVFLHSPKEKWPLSARENAVFGFDLLFSGWFEIRVREKFFLEEGASICAGGENTILIYGGKSSVHSDQDAIMQVLSIEKNQYVPRNYYLETKQILFGQLLPRAFHSAYLFENKMWIFGGEKPDLKKVAPANYLSSIEIVNDSDFKIIKKHDFSGFETHPQGRYFSQLIDENLYVWGGLLMYSEFGPLWMRNLKSKFCQSVSLNLTKRHYNLSFIHDNQLLFFQRSSCFVFNIVTRESHEEVFEIRDLESPIQSFKFAISHNQDLLLVTDKNEILRSSSLEVPTKDAFGNKIETNFQSLSPRVDINKKLYQEKLHSDITFVVENKKFPSHKSVLSAVSSYFDKMFSSGMSESHQKEIVITDLKAKAFEAFLEYAYCNEIKFDEEIAKELIVYGDKILFSNLKIECEKILARSINLENAIAIYEVSELAQAENLKGIALKFIKSNIKEITKEKGLDNISKSLLVELIDGKLLQ